MLDFSTRDASPQDPLFYERLEAFMDKSLADIKAFAERESRPFEEVFKGSLSFRSFASDISLRSDTTIRRRMAFEIFVQPTVG